MKPMHESSPCLGRCPTCKTEFCVLCCPSGATECPSCGEKGRDPAADDELTGAVLVESSSDDDDEFATWVEEPGKYTKDSADEVHSVYKGARQGRRRWQRCTTGTVHAESGEGDGLTGCGVVIDRVRFRAAPTYFPEGLYCKHRGCFGA